MRAFRKSAVTLSLYGLAASMALCTPAAAQDPAPAIPDTPDTPVGPTVPPKPSGGATRNFGGLEFGIGISFTLDWGGDARVASAELDPNGIVRISKREDGTARIMLESHYFFGVDRKNAKEAMIGGGPFIALQPGTDEFIEAIAIGGMIGLRYDEDTAQSFNIGVGLVVDPNTRLLGEGILPNQPLPAGETAIRYREEYETGWLILASFSF